MKSEPEYAFEEVVSKVYFKSGVVLLLVSLIMMVFFGLVAAASVLCGEVIIFFAGKMTGSSLGKATVIDPDHGQKVLIAGSAKRFLVVLLALAVAYMVGLNLLYVAAGFFLAQFVIAIFGFQISLSERFTLRG